MSPSPERAGAAPISPIPSEIVAGFNPKVAWPGLTMLMVSTTGEQHAFYRLNDELKPMQEELPEALRKSVERVTENCEPALCTVLFMAGAGGSLRAGVTENPVRLTRSVREALTTVTAGGAPVYVWPGGGITFMVDVTLLPKNAFGYVPTPAIVAPIEFTMRLDDYAALGGHVDEVRPLAEVLARREERATNVFVDGVIARSGAPSERARAIRRAARRAPAFPRRADRPHPGGVRRAGEVAAAYDAAAARFATMLDELCQELPRLRAARGPRPEGVVARRMADGGRALRRRRASSRRWPPSPAPSPRRFWPR